MIDLPKQAIEELAVILRDELGEEQFNQLDASDTEYIAELVLRTMALSLKVRARNGG